MLPRGFLPFSDTQPSVEKNNRPSTERLLNPSGGFAILYTEQALVPSFYTEEMFDALGHAAHYAVRADTYEDGMYTAFMVNRVKLSSIEGVKDHTENDSGLLLKLLRKERFAPWQEDSRMQRIVERLEPIAFMG